MVGFPVNFFVQPARFRSLPANSGSQNRRVEQWKASTPAAESGFRNCSSSRGRGGELPVEILELPLREAQDKREVCSDPAADFLDHLDGESRPRDRIAAIAVCAPIRSLPEKLVEQIPVGRVNLEAIEAERFGVCGGDAKALDHRVDLGLRHGLTGLFAGLLQARRAQWPNAA